MKRKPRSRKIYCSKSKKKIRSQTDAVQPCSAVSWLQGGLHSHSKAIVTARRTVRFPVLYSFCWLVGPCGLLCSLAPCRACKFLYAARRLSLEKRVSKSWSCHNNKKMILLLFPFLLLSSLHLIWALLPFEFAEKSTTSDLSTSDQQLQDPCCNAASCAPPNIRRATSVDPWMYFM